MKLKPAFSAAAFSALLAGIVFSPMGVLARAASGQSFVNSAAPAGIDGATGDPLARTPAAADAPDSGLCAQGKQAIDQGRWADAIKIFSQVAAQHGDHADGALYWKAYAEYELGQSKPSENSCAELRSNYPKSRWVEDCGALEVEIRARTGKPVVIDPTASDDVKLLALNAMLRQNEPQALAEIQQILNGDSSEKLKKEAEFILGHHYSDVTYAQIVRISYVEGDVRIQRGEPNGKASLGAWEQAVADLPLETGFSLVTGQGRAEIEFENASTMYLAENSVLTFNDLHETAGIPYTELALLSGTVSLHIHPYLAGERFILHTPTNDFVAKFPDKSYARIQAYTDAVAITPLEGNELRLPGVPKDEIQPGRTWTYLQGQLWTEAADSDNQAFFAWDHWVADREAQRATAISAVMEASGLTEPIPGMAEMQGEGKFFDCAPYGTCWEPNDDASQDEQGKDEQSSNQRQHGPANQQPRFEQAAYHPFALPGQAAQSGLWSTQVIDPFIDFPCTPGALRYRVEKDPVTGRQTVVSTGLVPSRRYGWAVCHAGSWIRHRKHYAWVAGVKRRHVDPVRWVKSGRTVAFVPLHPYDVRGQKAINARHEVFAVTGKNQITVQPVRFEPSLPIEYLKEPPREFRNAPMRPLAMAEVPHMEAHPFAYRQGAKGIDLSRAGVPIHFDAKSQSFQIAREEMRGGRTATVFAPMSNHSGTLQAHGGSFAGGSGFHGGSSASAGGASRGGGGGSSGGGGSHSGGGGVSSGSSSGSSGSSSSAGSSGGGSHH
jgi:hypothetical protein